MADPQHVIAAIDSALNDWSVSTDAMRSRPDAPPIPEDRTDEPDTVITDGWGRALCYVRADVEAGLTAPFTDEEIAMSLPDGWHELGYVDGDAFPHAFEHSGYPRRDGATPFWVRPSTFEQRPARASRGTHDSGAAFDIPIDAMRQSGFAAWTRDGDYCACHGDGLPCVPAPGELTYGRPSDFPEGVWERAAAEFRRPEGVDTSRIAAALEGMRETMREALQRVSAALEPLARITRHTPPADPAPDDPRERALYHRQHRNTGPQSVPFARRGRDTRASRRRL